MPSRAFVAMPEFQSTLSVRRATQGLNAATNEYEGISIHALRKESDGPCRSGIPRRTHFNPRSP